MKKSWIVSILEKNRRCFKSWTHYNNFCKRGHFWVYKDRRDIGNLHSYKGRKYHCECGSSLVIYIRRHIYAASFGPSGNCTEVTCAEIKMEKVLGD